MSISSFFSSMLYGPAPEDQSNQQPGSVSVVIDGDSELDKMKRLLAAKDAEIAALKAQNDKLSGGIENQLDDLITTFDGDNDDAMPKISAKVKLLRNQNKQKKNDAPDDDSKVEPKLDVTLSIRGTPEYDSYPYAMASDKFYYMASIKAPYFREENRAPIDLVAVVDESGSMSGDRITLVRETIQFIIKNLESGDRFGIVGYSSGSREVLPMTLMDVAGKKKAEQLASNLKAEGGTNLCQGLVDGVNMMRRRTATNEIASVLILTDGQANQGPTSAAEINNSVRQGKVVSGYGNVVTMSSPPRGRGGFGAPRGRGGLRGRGARGGAGLQPEGSNEGLVELPCTINTFGLGKDHNDLLLKALAENGHGMYAFIESKDKIAEIFAECLGGLVSVVGQNLKVQVQALNNVEINRCLVKSYPVKVDVPKKKHTISVKDIQSEESRDFIFELSVPQIEAEKKEDPLIQLSVQYDNVVRGGTDTLTDICNITRIDGKQIGERNLELDLQYNRVLAADAMAEANKLANNGKLADARKVLTTAQEHIKKSRTNQDQFCVDLVKDMQKIQSNMVDHSSYRSKGAKMLVSNCESQMMQRSTNSTAYGSQMKYESRAKRSKKSKARKYKSEH